MTYDQRSKIDITVFNIKLWILTNNKLIILSLNLLQNFFFFEIGHFEVNCNC